MKKLTALFLVLAMAFAMVPTAFAEDVVQIRFMMSENANQPLLQNTPVLNYIKDKFGVEIVYQAVPGSDYKTKIATSFATGDIADVTYGVTPDQIAACDAEDLFLNLLDVKDQLPNFMGLAMDESNPTRFAATQAAIFQNSDGEDAMYIMRQMEYNRVAIAPISAIRGDLLDEQNLPRPTTWTELYDVMLKIKEKHPDIYFFSSRSKLQRILACLAYGMGSGGFGTFDLLGMYYEPETNLWTYGPTEEPFRAVAQYLANAYKDGLVDPDYATNSADNLWEKLGTGKVAYFNDNNSFIARTIMPAFKKGGHDDWYFELLAPLKNDVTGTARVLRYELDWSDGIVISKDCEHLDKLLPVLDWLYSPEGSEVTNLGIEGETFYVDENGNKLIVDSIMEQTAGAADQYAAINSVIGGGIWGLSQYIDEAPYRQIYGDLFFEHGDQIKEWTDEGLIHYKYVTPSFTVEEQEEVTELSMNLQNVFDSNIDAFITGARSMDDWDAFVAEQKDDAARLCEIYNAAAAR